MYDRPSDSNFDDVGRFHTKFGLPVSDETGPKEFTKELMEFRLKFLLEELQELAQAFGMEIKRDAEGVLTPQWVFGEGTIDHAEAFDALLDLTYVAMGTAHFLGYPWREGWNEVQRANMSKVRAQSSGESKRGTALDVVKPEGWKAPDIDRVIGQAGFSPWAAATDGAHYSDPLDPIRGLLAGNEIKTSPEDVD